MTILRVTSITYDVIVKNFSNDLVCTLSSIINIIDPSIFCVLVYKQYLNYRLLDEVVTSLFTKLSILFLIRARFTANTKKKM